MKVNIQYPPWEPTAGGYGRPAGAQWATASPLRWLAAAGSRRHLSHSPLSFAPTMPFTKGVAQDFWPESRRDAGAAADHALGAADHALASSSSSELLQSVSELLSGSGSTSVAFFLDLLP